MMKRRYFFSARSKKRDERFCFRLTVDLLQRLSYLFGRSSNSAVHRVSGPRYA